MSVCVGVDVSKDHLDWVLGSSGKIETVANSARGVSRLIASLKKVKFDLVVVESTGGYERRFVEALERQAIPVALVNPWRVRRFAEGLGVLAKTDSLDAKVLAIFGDRAQPPQRPPRSETERLLADLVRRRRQLITIIVAEKSRLETAVKEIRQDIKSLVAILERRIEKLDTRIDDAIAEDAHKAEDRAILESAPCVGPGIARALIVDLPELGTLARREIASLCGLAPFARDSGRKSGARHIRAGRAAPRSALYMVALNGARFNPALKTMYDRLIKAGKPPKVALVAIARKLLVILNAMLRDRTRWPQMTP
jgi:transposase